MLLHIANNDAEGAGLEPARAFTRRFSRPVPYHSAQPSVHYPTFFKIVLLIMTVWANKFKIFWAVIISISIFMMDV
jgi:hypothetical protein